MDNQDIISKIRIDYVKLPPDAQIPAHEQETWELAYVINGSGIRAIGDISEHFSAGEILLIPPGIRHHWKFDPSDTDADGYISNIALFFHSSLLYEIAENIPDFRSTAGSVLSRTEAVCFTGQRLLGLRRLLLHIINETEKEVRLIRLLQILVLLAAKPRGEEVKGGRRQKTKPQMKIDSVRIYCECNYMREVSLYDAATLAGMNTSSFCKFFRHSFGRSFTEHINHLRIEEACRQLLNSDKNVSVIAYDSGFTCIPYFNRLFQKMCGMSPSIFRKTAKPPEDDATEK